MSKPDFKLFARCDACHKRKLFIRKRSVKLPIGQRATSQDLFCGSCSHGLQEQITKAVIK